MSDPTPPAVSDAMREAVARVLSQTLDVACRIPPDCCPGTLEGVADAVDALCASAAPIASEIARLTGEREAMLRDKVKAYGIADLAEARADNAEAEAARLRAALEAAADAVGRASAELRKESNHAAAEVAFTAAKTARAALSSQEQADV